MFSKNIARMEWIKRFTGENLAELACFYCCSPIRLFLFFTKKAFTSHLLFIDSCKVFTLLTAAMQVAV